MGRHAARSNCPFCGHPYTELVVVPVNYRRTVCYVECSGCKARGPQHSTTQNMGQSERVTKSAAVTGWQRRAEFLDRHGLPAPRVPIDGLARAGR